ncbi:MAG: hypothetical protein K0R17_2457, partial [Rariglobus sp.]|nr:hypothetical protein [Rariglobus sp.]
MINFFTMARFALIAVAGLVHLTVSAQALTTPSTGAIALGS